MNILIYLPLPGFNFECSDEVHEHFNISNLVTTNTALFTRIPFHFCGSVFCVDYLLRLTTQYDLVFILNFFKVKIIFLEPGVRLLIGVRKDCSSVYGLIQA
jgi:hypothetical protein